MTSVFRGLVPFSRFRVLELQVPHLIKTRRFLYEGTLLAALMFVFTCKVLPSPNSPGEGGRQGLGLSAGCAGVAEVLCASWGRFESGNKSSEEGGPGRSPAGPVVEIHTPKAGAWGRSLVRELRFHLLHDMAQKKWLFNFLKKVALCCPAFHTVRLGVFLLLSGVMLRGSLCPLRLSSASSLQLVVLLTLISWWFLAPSSDS